MVRSPWSFVEDREVETIETYRTPKRRRSPCCLAEESDSMTMSLECVAVPLFRAMPVAERSDVPIASNEARRRVPSETTRELTSVSGSIACAKRSGIVYRGHLILK